MVTGTPTREFVFGALRAQFRNMAKQGHFSICPITDAREALGFENPRPPFVKALSILHCVNFSLMPAEIQFNLPAQILFALDSPDELDIEEVRDLLFPPPKQIVAIEQRPSKWRKLLLPARG